MNHKHIAEELASCFIDNPINFVTEVDLQVKLVQLLEDRLEEKENKKSTITDLELKGTSKNNYKKKYWQEIQEKLKNLGCIDRVHTEVSVEEGERMDVVVFDEEMNEKIKWIKNGSKRFEKGDISAIFELKYIKNKRKFPTKKGITNEDIKELEAEEIFHKHKEEDILDFDENNLKGEIERLDEIDNSYMLIFSNNNYLYQGKMTEGEKNHKKFYRDLGQAARKELRKYGEANNVNILYIHPRMKEKGNWIVS